MCALFASASGFVSRSGPIVPLVPAGLKVWQLAQALARKTDFPFAELLDAGVVFVVVATLVVATLVDVIIRHRNPAEEDVPAVLFPAKDVER